MGHTDRRRQWKRTWISWIGRSSRPLYSGSGSQQLRNSMIAVESAYTLPRMSENLSCNEPRRRVMMRSTTLFGDEDIDSQSEPSSSRLMNLIFIPFRLAGIVESPRSLWNGRSSVLFKIYSGVLLLLTFVGWLRCVHQCFHFNEDPLLKIIGRKLTIYSRLTYTIISLKAFGCRLVCFLLFNFNDRRITDAYLRIASE